jgi:hypothetical protein
LYPRPVANGESWFQTGVPVTVPGEYEFTEPSARYAPEAVFNNNEVAVPVIAEILVPAD